MTMICVTCGTGEIRRVREYVASGPVVIIGTFILMASILVGVYGVFGIMTAQPDVLAVVNRGNAILPGPLPTTLRWQRRSVAWRSSDC